MIGFYIGDSLEAARMALVERIEGAVSRAGDFLKHLAVIVGVAAIVFGPVLYFFGEKIEERASDFVRGAINYEMTDEQQRLASLEDRIKRIEDGLRLFEKDRDEIDAAYNLSFVFDGSRIIEGSWPAQMEQFYAEPGQRAFLTLRPAMHSRRVLTAVTINGKPIPADAEYDGLNITCLLEPPPLARAKLQHTIEVNIDPSGAPILKDEQLRLNGFLLLKKSLRNATSC